ncbi:O-antigen ligase family protein [Hirschia litorea]|uniref:O-antigen ligase family protein n=1 Tax=Hirschia litorea TaxID=1199156 RepID=A0ABW2IPT3_9PROT
MVESIEIGKKSSLSWILVATIFSALIFGGANNAVLSSFYSGVISILVTIGLAFYALKPWQEIDWTLKWALLFLVLFLGYIILTLIPNPILPAHPAWEMISDEAGIATISFYRTIEGLAAFIGFISAFFAARMFTQSRTGRDAFFKAIIWLSIPYCLYALSLYGAQGGRLMVNYTSANSAATSFYLLFFLSMNNIFVLLYKGSSKNMRFPIFARLLLDAPVSLVALILSLVCLLVTASRTGIALTCVGCVAIFFLNAVFMQKGKIKTTVSKIAVMSVAAVIIFVGFGSNYVLRRFDESLAQHAQTREVLVETHWNLFLQRPVFGHGMNSFHDLNQLAATPENWASIVGVGSTHNIFVNALEEVGVIGFSLGCLLGLCLIAGVVGHLARSKLGSTDSYWALTTCVAICICLLHGLVDFGLQVPAIAYLVMALLGAAGARNSKELSRR